MTIHEPIRAELPVNTGFALTERAAVRIAELAGGAALALRVEVKAGGCSGFQYVFDLVAPAQDDIVIECNGARAVVDPVSLGFLGGAELDFVDDLMGASFQVRNPNVVAACGCGVSFAL